MKKISAFLLLFILLFNTTICVFAENATNYGAEQYKITPSDFTVDANSALLMDAETGEILFSQNETNSQSPASVTKIMTLLLVMEAIDEGKLSLSDSVNISAYAASMGGSQVFLEEGEEMSVEDLIKCTVIASANDAAVALAEAVSGSEEAFVRSMNERAAELGLKNTVFENTTGLDDTTKNHVSSAMDIAIMSRELIKHELITKYSSLWQDTIRGGEFTLTNTNRLVRYYDGCNGLKTGSTDKAGFCISATAKRGDMQLIAVVMGAKTRDVRNEIARKLLDFGFANYALYSHPEKEIDVLPIYSGVEDSITVCSEGFSAVINKSDIKRVSLIFDIPDKISAPIYKGDTVGSIRFEIDGKHLGEVRLFVKRDVDKIGIFGLFGRILHTVLTGNASAEK